MPRRSARLAKKRDAKRKRPIVSESSASDEYEPSLSSESEAEKMGISRLSDLDVYKCPSAADTDYDSDDIKSDPESISCSSEPPAKRRRLNSMSPSLSCSSTSLSTPMKINSSTSLRSPSRRHKRGPNKFSVTTGGGFSTKAKALQTVDYIKGRDVRYQINMIKAFQCGAKSILRKAKTKQKRVDIQEAIGVFECWLKDYESKKEHIEMFDHLPLNVMEEYESLVDLYNLEERKKEEMEYDEDHIFEVEKSYFRVLQESDGEIRALRSTPIVQGENEDDHDDDGDNKSGDGNDCDDEENEEDEESQGISWDIARNIKLLEFKGKLMEQDIRCNGMMRTVDEALLYYKRGKLKGFPSRIHLQMIMYGYSPNKNAIKRLAKSVAKTVKQIKGGYKERKKSKNEFET